MNFSDGNSFGRLIIQDGGKKHPALITAWISAIVIVSVCVGILLWTLTVTPRGFIMIGGIGGLRINHSDVLIFARIFLVLLIFRPLYSGFVAHSKISSTIISVYEGGVKGVGISPKLASEIEGLATYNSKDTTSSEFSLLYNQISTADITEDRISINTPGKQYVIYVSKPREVVEAINRQKAVGSS